MKAFYVDRNLTMKLIMLLADLTTLKGANFEKFWRALTKN
jgi:hypothetical protein